MISLCIVSPSRGVSDAHAEMLMKLTAECVLRKIRLDRKKSRIPGLLHHARNILLVQAAKDERSTHILWLDTDITFEPSIIFEHLERPELAGDAVAMVYPKRDRDLNSIHDAVINYGSEITFEQIKLASMGWPYCCTPALVDGKLVQTPDGRLVEMVHLGFGYVLFRRQALADFCEWMTVTYPERATRNWNGEESVGAFDLTAAKPCRHQSGHGVPNGSANLSFLPGKFYTIEKVPQIRGGEDVGFWARWCEFGRRVWVDPMPVCANGQYGGSYSDHLVDTFDWKRPPLQFKDPWGRRFQVPGQPEQSKQCAAIMAQAIFQGEYDAPDLLPVLELSSHRKPHIIDVGSNVGGFVRWAQHKWGDYCTFDLYEPNAACWEHLEHNTQGDDVTIHHEAVTSDPAPELYIDRDFGMVRTAMLPESGGERRKVPAIHPRELPKADVLKIDAEGVEPEIIAHYPHLRDCQVVMFEWHEDSHYDSIAAILTESGMKELKHRPDDNPALSRGISVWAR